MKKFNSMSDREIVLQNVWRLFDVLRHDLNTEDYSVILLFLYLRSTNTITEQLPYMQEHKEALVQMLKNTNDISVKRVFQIFLPSLERLSEQTINDLVEVLISIDSEWLQQNISIVYDETLERIALSKGRKSGEFIQPKQLTEFINTYIGSTKGLKVFNPFAGVASFIIDREDSDLVYAQELNQKTWAIGQLRLIAHKSSANFRCEDSIMDWPNHEQFDLIVSNPPFGMRLNGLYKKQFPNFRTAEEFLLNMGMNSLSNFGKLIAVFPHGILFRGGSEKKLRKQLIQEDLIDTIISLPGGLLFHSGIPILLLILNKSKDFPGKIKLVDANSFTTKISPKESVIDVDKLLHATNSLKDNKDVRIISNKDVADNDFNLNIPRYFQEEIEGVKLKKLFTDFKGNKRNLPENGKIIRIRDLKDDLLDYLLNIEELEEAPLKKISAQEINTSCLLLAVRGKYLKPSFFHFEKEPVFTTAEILPFQVDESKVDITYLINELHADYVQQQLESLRVGGSIPYISKDDLLEIKVKLPSTEVQRAKVSVLKEISDKIKQLQLERNALAHDVSTSEFDEFASLKHTLGRPRQNILGWSKNLSKFFIREKEAISALDAEFKEFFNLGIIEAISEINRDIKFISDVLEKGENGLILSDYQKTIIPLTEVNSIFNEISNNEFKFSIKKQLLKVDEKKTRGILINKVLFKTLLDNLLTNANKYGFKEKEKGNHVMMELSEIENQLIVEIRNNGLPFPNNFDREKFIMKYSTADSINGSGLGGYDINRIATYFENEDWELALNSDPIYPVIFRFSFQIKSI